MKQFFDYFFGIIGVGVIVLLFYLEKINNPNKPTIHPPDSKLDKEMRDSATRNKWV
jgi:hypothetical protein